MENVGLELRFYWIVPVAWLVLVGMSGDLAFDGIPRLESDNFTWCCNDGPSAATARATVVFMPATNPRPAVLFTANVPQFTLRATRRLQYTTLAPEPVLSPTYRPTPAPTAVEALPEIQPRKRMEAGYPSPTESSEMLACERSRVQLAKNSRLAAQLREYCTLSFSMYCLGFVLLTACWFVSQCCWQCGYTSHQSRTVMWVAFGYQIFSVAVACWSMAVAGYATPILDQATTEITELCFPSSSRRNLWSSWDRAEFKFWLMSVIMGFIVVVDMFVRELQAQRHLFNYNTAMGYHDPLPYTRRTHRSDGGNNDYDDDDDNDNDNDNDYYNEDYSDNDENLRNGDGDGADDEAALDRANTFGGSRGTTRRRNLRSSRRSRRTAAHAAATNPPAETSGSIVKID